MSLTIFNGSPRGKASNSSKISEWFIKGYGQAESVHYLNKFKAIDEQIKAFLEADQIMMVFPLYVDGMPGQVKHFFEALDAFSDQIQGKKIIYFIHSGFSEGIQNRALELFLNRVSDIYKFENYGVVILPGSEGFRLMPDQMVKRQIKAVANIAHTFKLNQPFVASDLKALNKKEQMGSVDKIVFGIFSKLGLNNLYWNSNLKRNHAFDKRFDAPYADGPVPVTTKAYIKNY